MCKCTSNTDPTCASDPAYETCTLDLNRDLITGTAAIAGIGSILMGLFSNLPVAVAPGMGMNACTSDVLSVESTTVVCLGALVVVYYSQGIEVYAQCR